MNEEINESITYRQYTNNNQFINLRIYTNVSNINVDNEKHIYEQEYEINGSRAIVTLQSEKINIIWNNDNNMFQLSTNLPLENALDMARKIQ